jgi:hypothetical protein
MTNSRPVQLMRYTCGHSTPVKGSGATVDRACPECAKDARRARQFVKAHHPYYCAQCAESDFSQNQ